MYTNFEIGVGKLPIPIDHSTSETVIHELVIMANETQNECAFCFGWYGGRAQKGVVDARADAMVSQGNSLFHRKRVYAAITGEVSYHRGAGNKSYLSTTA